MLQLMQRRQVMYDTTGTRSTTFCQAGIPCYTRSAIPSCALCDVSFVRLHLMAVQRMAAHLELLDIDLPHVAFGALLRAL